MIRKISIIIVTIILLFVFYGCDNTVKVDDGFDYTTDCQYQYSRFHVNSYPITKSENGYYVFQHGFLYYIESDTMMATALCDKPNCLHNDPDECNAYYDVNAIGDIGNLIQFNEGNIYVVLPSYNQSNEFEGDVLTSVSQDGKNREEKIKIKNKIDKWLIHRGYFYYVVSDYELSDDGSPETDNFVIYRLPMSDLNCQPEEVYNSNNKLKIYELKTFVAYGDYVYIEISFELNDTFETQIISINTEDYNNHIVGNDIGNVYVTAFVNNKILFNRLNSEDEENGIFKYYYCDLSGENSEFAFDRPLGDSLYFDGTYFYCDNTGELETQNTNCYGQKIIVYDLDFNEVDSFVLPFEKEVYSFSPQDNRAFIFLDQSNSDNAQIGYIDKKEIGNYNGAIAEYHVSVDIPKTISSNIGVSEENNTNNLTNDSIKVIYEKAKQSSYKVFLDCDISVDKNILEGFSVKLYWYEKNGTCTGEFPVFVFENKTQAETFCKKHPETIQNDTIVVDISTNQVPKEIYDMLKSIVNGKPINPINPNEFSGETVTIP